MKSNHNLSGIIMGIGRAALPALIRSGALNDKRAAQPVGYNVTVEHRASFIEALFAVAQRRLDRSAPVDVDIFGRARSLMDWIVAPQRFVDRGAGGCEPKLSALSEDGVREAEVGIASDVPSEIAIEIYREMLSAVPSMQAVYLLQRVADAADDIHAWALSMARMFSVARSTLYRTMCLVSDSAQGKPVDANTIDHFASDGTMIAATSSRGLFAVLDWTCAGIVRELSDDNALSLLPDKAREIAMQEFAALKAANSELIAHMHRERLAREQSESFGLRHFMDESGSEGLSERVASHAIACLYAINVAKYYTEDRDNGDGEFRAESIGVMELAKIIAPMMGRGAMRARCHKACDRIADAIANSNGGVHCDACEECSCGSCPTYDSSDGRPS